MTVKTPGSKLKFRLTGLKEVDDGVVDAKDLDSENNVCYIAPGYVYAEIDPTSATGTFTFSPTVTRFGMIKDGSIDFRDGKIVGWRSRSSSSALGKLAATASQTAKLASSMTVGLNPLLRYGYGQNSHSAGVIAVRAFGVNLTSSRGSLMVNGEKLVTRGRLQI